MTEIETARAAVVAARRVRSEISARLGRSRSMLVRVRKSKAKKALLAAQGDEGAIAALAAANASLVKVTLEAEDLEEAVVQGDGQIAAAEAALAAVEERGRADRVERLAEELAAAAASIDRKFEELFEAFERRDEVARRLYAEAPTIARDAGLRLQGPGAATRAARGVGLQRYMRLAWQGLPEAPLSVAYPVPEVERLVSELRAVSPQDKEAA